MLAAISSLLCQCAFNSSSGFGGPPNMGGPTVEERNAVIASEATGDFLYGRRYHVQKTRDLNTTTATGKYGSFDQILEKGYDQEGSVSVPPSSLSSDLSASLRKCTCPTLRPSVLVTFAS